MTRTRRLCGWSNIRRERYLELFAKQLDADEIPLPPEATEFGPFDFPNFSRLLKRIVSMLTRLIARADVVSESSTDYNPAVEYEYRDAEYEYEHEEEEPEPSRAPEPILRPLSDGQSTFPAR